MLLHFFSDKGEECQCCKQPWKISSAAKKKRQRRRDLFQTQVFWRFAFNKCLMDEDEQTQTRNDNYKNRQPTSTVNTGARPVQDVVPAVTKLSTCCTRKITIFFENGWMDEWDGETWGTLKKSAFWQVIIEFWIPTAQISDTTWLCSLTILLHPPRRLWDCLRRQRDADVLSSLEESTTRNTKK